MAIISLIFQKQKTCLKFWSWLRKPVLPAGFSQEATEDRLRSGGANSGAGIWVPPRRARGGRAGPGGAGRAEEGSCRSSGRRPPACPGLASGRSLRLLPAPSPSPPVLPSPLVHDGNTMAAAAQLSLTQVTPSAPPPGSAGRCPRSTPASLPPPSKGSPTPGIYSLSAPGGAAESESESVCVCAGGREGAIPSRLLRWGSRGPARPGRGAPPAPPLAALPGSPAPPHPRGVDRDSRPALSLHSAFTHPGSFLPPGQSVPGERLLSPGAQPRPPSALGRAQRFPSEESPSRAGRPAPAPVLSQPTTCSPWRPATAPPFPAASPPAGLSTPDRSHPTCPSASSIHRQPLPLPLSSPGFLRAGVGGGAGSGPPRRSLLLPPLGFHCDRWAFS